MTMLRTEAGPTQACVTMQTDSELNAIGHDKTEMGFGKGACWLPGTRTLDVCRSA